MTLRKTQPVRFAEAFLAFGLSSVSLVGALGMCAAYPSRVEFRISGSIVFAVWLLSAGWFRRERRFWRQVRRASAGQCLGCGYDLRSSPGRCPECGAASDR